VRNGALYGDEAETSDTRHVSTTQRLRLVHARKCRRALSVVDYKMSLRFVGVFGLPRQFVRYLANPHRSATMYGPTDLEELEL
jgi:hypothetical protein